MPQFRDNFHSEEAQEIMGRAPSWVVRWGITVIFVILALIVLGCYIIKYPQTVTAPISITTVNAPSDLTARYDGLLDSVCVGNGENVRTGQLIALLATPADYDDIRSLEENLSYRYICRHPKQNLAMALYRLESDRTQIGIDLDTKTRDNDLRHPDYARHAQIMRLVYVQSLLSGQSILQTIPSLADHFPQLDPFNPEHQACVCCIWDAAFDLHRPPHMRIGRTDCAYFFTERASCEYYRNYSGMSSAQLCEVQILETYDCFTGDMRWLDAIDERTATARDIAAAAVRYWAGEMSADPHPEVLFQGRYRLTPVP